MNECYRLAMTASEPAKGGSFNDGKWAVADAIANATGDDDAAPECTCAAKDMTFGRCCKVTPNGEVRGASRLAGEASSAEGATSTDVLEGDNGGKR